MKANTSIEFVEFDQCTTFTGKDDTYSITVREHPEFGKWQQKKLDLSYIRITEHKVDLTREINVNISDKMLTDQVNHCMCIDGSLGAHFNQQDLRADLNPGTYHYLSVQADEYALAMSKNFHNIHIEVSREYYTGLLCDVEEWSATLKGKIIGKDVLYPGEFFLTPGMIHSLNEMFSSPLSGSLKRLLAEAKVHELVALQLNTARLGQQSNTLNRKNKALMLSIRDYLNGTYLEPHSLKGICLQFGINEFALKRGFKENFQSSVFDFILSRRLDHAKELLQDTKATIREVGTIVGYKYPNHFSTAFKNKFGFSPGKLVSLR